MEILFVLIPLSLVLVGLAVGAFVWAVHGGQFDAGEEEAGSPLRDDPRPPP